MLPNIVIALVTLFTVGFVHSLRTYKDVLVIVGNFSLDGEFVNIAQYDINTHVWSNIFQTDLMQDDGWSSQNSQDARLRFGSDASTNGVILDVGVNRTGPSDVIYVVGTFDTVADTSQDLYCSVAAWNGYSFKKLGQGICPRGTGPLSYMRVQAVAVGDQGYLFVGGSFAAQVWDINTGHPINIYHLAMYNEYYKGNSWMPLLGGRLKSTQGDSVRVNSLVWDDVGNTLYVGGVFDAVDSDAIASGLAMWSSRTGLQGLPGAGAGLVRTGGGRGYADIITFDSKSKTLFVAGQFDQVDSVECSSVAAWSRRLGSWTCLYDVTKGISTITAILLVSSQLYIAGWVSPSSDWQQKENYGIAVADVGALLALRPNAPINLRSAQSLPHLSFSNDSTVQRQLTSWTPHWSWLQHYFGTSGPIVRLTAGSGRYQGCIFIVGAFTNSQSAIVWCPCAANCDEDMTWISSISSNNKIEGLITNIVQVRLQVSSVNPVVIPVTIFSSLSSRLAVLFSTVSFLLFYVFWRVRSKHKLHDDSSYVIAYTREKITSENNDSGEEEKLESFSLHALSGGESSAGEDTFKKCFAKAMKARHLQGKDGQQGLLRMVDSTEVTCSKNIGEGSFGRVWKGQWRNSTVAVKEFIFAQAAINGQSLQQNEMIEEIVGEAGIMSCLRHPNILQLFGCSLTLQAIWLVSEYCNRGSLRNLLKDSSVKLTSCQKLSICLDVAEAMAYLHARTPAIIHRDLKSHNIFINKTNGKYIAKVGDWGSARAVALTGCRSNGEAGVSKAMTQGVGTACWLSPEMILHDISSEKSDVYAFGIVLWEVWTRLEVYEGLSMTQIIAKVAADNLRPPTPLHCPWAAVMTKAWHREASDRPNFEYIRTTLHTFQSNLMCNDSDGVEVLEFEDFPLLMGGALTEARLEQLAQNHKLTKQKGGILYDASIDDEDDNTSASDSHQYKYYQLSPSTPQSQTSRSNFSPFSSTKIPYPYAVNSALTNTLSQVKRKPTITVMYQSISEELPCDIDCDAGGYDTT